MNLKNTLTCMTMLSAAKSAGFGNPRNAFIKKRGAAFAPAHHKIDTPPQDNQTNPAIPSITRIPSNETSPQALDIEQQIKEHGYLVIPLPEDLNILIDKTEIFSDQLEQDDLHFFEKNLIRRKIHDIETKINHWAKDILKPFIQKHDLHYLDMLHSHRHLSNSFFHIDHSKNVMGSRDTLYDRVVTLHISVTGGPPFIVDKSQNYKFNYGGDDDFTQAISKRYCENILRKLGDKFDPEDVKMVPISDKLTRSLVIWAAGSAEKVIKDVNATIHSWPLFDQLPLADTLKKGACFFEPDEQSRICFIGSINRFERPALSSGLN